MVISTGIKSQALNGGGIKVKLVSCSCGSAWCPKCFRKGGLKKILGKLEKMNWKKVRHIVLTFERHNFITPKFATLYIKEKKSISNLMRNLNRTVGKELNDWVWIREFHRDGWPHFHLIVETTELGFRGQIGGDALRKYWPFGAVHESYIKDERHWKGMVGYLGKTGYFGEDKHHQGELPKWALEDIETMRRWGAKGRPIEGRIRFENNKIQEEIKESCVENKDEKRKRRPYGLIIEGCGTKSYIGIDGDFGFSGFGLGRVVDVEYKQLRKILEGGEYVEGVGYCVEYDFDTLMMVLSKHESLLGLKQEIEEVCFEQDDFVFVYRS